MIWSLMATLSLAFASESKIIFVTGQCVKESQPDRAGITLTSETREQSAQSASEKVTKLYEKVRQEIKKTKLADLKLQTSDFTVQPVIDYENGKQKRRGYMAQMGLVVETSDIARMGEVIELAAKLGVQNVSQLSTFLSSTKGREERESCLEEAIKNARLKAERMAKAGGSSLGGVVSIEEFQREDRPRPIPIAMKSAQFEAASAAPSFESKAQEISVQVYVTFSLK